MIVLLATSSKEGILIVKYTTIDNSCSAICGWLLWRSLLLLGERDSLCVTYFRSYVLAGMAQCIAMLTVVVKILILVCADLLFNPVWCT